MARHHSLPAPEVYEKENGMDKEQAKIELIKWLHETLKSGVDVAKQEVPVFLTEFARYAAIEHVSYCLIGLFLLFIGAFLLLKLFKNVKQMSDGSFTAAILLSSFIFLIGMVMLLSNIGTALGVLFAPRGYLLERFIL